MKRKITLVLLLVFTVLTFIQGRAGDIRIAGAPIYLLDNRDYALDVYLEAYNFKLGAYSLEIRYDSVYLEPLPVEPAQISGYTLFANAEEAGLLRITGIHNPGTDPQPRVDMLIFTFTFRTKAERGVTAVEVNLKEILNTERNPVGPAYATERIQKLSINHYLPGDVDGNEVVDIVDALIIARQYIGLNPSIFFPDPYDVNCDGNITIVDALMVAQYYVGLITTFCRLPYRIDLPAPGPPTQAGEIWFFPQVKDVIIGQDFSVDLYMNFGTQWMTAYQIEIGYEPSLLIIDQSRGTAGVQPSSAGILAAVNSADPGRIIINAFNLNGIAIPRGGHFLTLFFQAQSATGISPLHISITELLDINYQPIGTPTGKTGAIRISPAVPGDVNADQVIDLQDALIVMQNGGELPLPASDMNCDGYFSREDSVILTEYTAGVTVNFCGLVPVPKLPPAVQPGTVSINPTRLHILSNDRVNLDLQLASGTQDVADFDLTVNYDPGMLTFISAVGNDVFMLDVDASQQGVIRLGGAGHSDAGTDIQLAGLTFQALGIPGNTLVDTSVNRLLDLSGNTVGIPLGSSNEIKIRDFIPGDVNGDSLVNIVDAQMNFTCYMGHEEYCHDNEAVLDLNHDGTVNIIDALLIAMYAAGNTEL